MYFLVVELREVIKIFSLQAGVVIAPVFVFHINMLYVLISVKKLRLLQRVDSPHFHKKTQH